MAQAENYPSRPVRVIVPYPAGGTTDIVARVIAQRLSTMWGQPVIVENRPGAGGNVGMEFVAHAPPDGYTLLMSGVSFAINPGLYKTLPFDPLKDFFPITEVASTPEIVEVPPTLQVNSIKELLDLARSKPQELNYGSAGYGTTLHLSGALFTMMANVKMTHVPYKGVSEALVDLMAGRVQMVIDSLPSSLALIKGGKVKAIAVTTPQRVAAFPDLPTVSESGIPGYEATSWYGAFAPAGVPPDIRKKLEADFIAAIQSPDTQKQLLTSGAIPIGSTSEQFSKYIKAEMDKWTNVVASSGARVEGR
jgi:tripartite-type tricarboxylate transporter receptor subunit TctC